MIQLRKDDVIKIAYKKLKKKFVYAPALDIEDDLLYGEHIDFQVRKMVIENAMTEGNYNIIEYSVLVNKEDYKRQCVAMAFDSNLQPPELNEKRCEALKQAETEMRDVVGYDDVAIVKKSYKYEIKYLSMAYLYDALFRNNERWVFLWFNFKGENNDISIPVIEW